MTKFQALAQKYDTPLYVYDFDTISNKFSALKEVFKARKSLICFARNSIRFFTFIDDNVANRKFLQSTHWRFEISNDNLKPFTSDYDEFYISTSDDFEDNNEFNLTEKNVMNKWRS